MYLYSLFFFFYYNILFVLFSSTVIKIFLFHRDTQVGKHCFRRCQSSMPAVPVNRYHSRLVCIQLNKYKYTELKLIFPSPPPAPNLIVLHLGSSITDSDIRDKQLLIFCTYIRPSFKRTRVVITTNYASAMSTRATV